MRITPLRAVAAIAVLAVLVAWGARVLRDRREGEARAALRAELEAAVAAALAARGPVPPAPAGENGADLYHRATAVSVTNAESTACNMGTFFPLFWMDGRKPLDPAAAAAAERNAAYLDLVARAAAAPSCRFPAIDPSDPEVPELPTGKFALLAQLLEVRGRADLEAGRIAAAPATVRLLAKFGGDFLPGDARHLAAGAWILHHAAGVAERAAVHPDLDEATARALLGALPDPASLDRAFEEAAAIREIQVKAIAAKVLRPRVRTRLFTYLRWQPVPECPHDLWRFVHPPEEARIFFRRTGRPDPDASDVRELLGAWEEFRSAWRGPPTGIYAAEQAILGRMYREACIHGPTLSSDVLWASTYPRSFVLHLQGRLACARAALGVRLFELKNGRPPEDLAGLVPAFLDAVPLDPWDGKPVRFAAKDEGWLVYVVGPDGRDDGGRKAGNLDDRGLRYVRAKDE